MIFCRSNNGGFILNIVWLKHSGLLFSIQSGLMNRPNFSGPIAFLTWAFSKLPSLWPGLALNPHRLPPCQSTFQTHSEWLRYPRTVFGSCYPANRIEIKLIYSEKATTFCEIFPLILTVCIAGWRTLCIKEHFTQNTHFASQELNTLCSKEHLARHTLLHSTPCSLTPFATQNPLLLITPYSLTPFATQSPLLLITPCS